MGTAVSDPDEGRSLYSIKLWFSSLFFPSLNRDFNEILLLQSYHYKLQSCVQVPGFPRCRV